MSSPPSTRDFNTLLCHRKLLLPLIDSDTTPCPVPPVIFLEGICVDLKSYRMIFSVHHAEHQHPFSVHVALQKAPCSVQLLGIKNNRFHCFTAYRLTLEVTR